MNPKRLLTLPLTAICLAVLFVLPVQADQQAFVRSADDPELEWGPCPEFIPEGCRIAVLQGNPDEPNADIFFKLPAGTPVPHHRHTSAERMILVRGEMKVDYDGQDPVIMKTGNYAYGPAGLPHSARCTEAGPCILFIAFEQPVDAMPVTEE